MYSVLEGGAGAKAPKLRPRNKEFHAILYSFVLCVCVCVCVCVCMCVCARVCVLHVCI